MRRSGAWPAAGAVATRFSGGTSPSSRLSAERFWVAARSFAGNVAASSRCAGPGGDVLGSGDGSMVAAAGWASALASLALTGAQLTTPAGSAVARKTLSGVSDGAMGFLGTLRTLMGPVCGRNMAGAEAVALEAGTALSFESHDFCLPPRPMKAFKVLLTVENSILAIRGFRSEICCRAGKTDRLTGQRL